MAISSILRGVLAAMAAIFVVAPSAALADGRPPAGTANCEGVDDQPGSLPGAKSQVYRTASGRDLMIHVFEPATGVSDRPAVLFYFGGGWRRGTVAQFAEQAKAFQARGYVAALADYRVFCRDSSTPMDAVEDARAAYAWFRAHGGEFGVDQRRIALAGGSSGGQLALATAQLGDPAERPAALVLFNPAADLNPPAIRAAIGVSEADALRISPSSQPVEGLPPMILFHGVNDQVAPIRQARALCERVQAARGSCKLKEYPGQPHGFFNSRAPDPALDRSPYEDTLAGAMAFLTGLGWP